MRQAKAMNRAAVAYCNAEIDHDGFAKRKERIERALIQLCDRFTDLEYLKGKMPNISYELGGDPRGYTLKLQLPSKRYNTFGGVEEGWGVPGS